MKGRRENKPDIVCRWYDMDIKFFKILAFKFIMKFITSAQCKVSQCRQLYFYVSAPTGNKKIQGDSR